MTLIDLDSIQFYRAPTKADLAGKRPSMASIGDVSVICGDGCAPTVPRSSGGWGGRLDDCDLIEVLDLTGTSSKDPLDLSYKQASDLKGTELYAGAPSSGLDLSGGRGRGRDGREEDESFPSLEELLLGGGGAQESQQSGLIPGGNKGANTDSSSNVHSRSNGSTSEQGERCSILREKTENPISDPPPLLPTTLLSSTYDTQICFKNIEPHHSGGGEERKDKVASCSTDNIIPYSLRSPIAMWSPTQVTNAEPETTTGATDIRDSSKRTADTAGLNDGGESAHRFENARRADPIMIDETDDTDDDLSDLEFARIRSQPKPVFRRPPSPRNFQQREETTSSSRSSEVGDSQGLPPSAFSTSTRDFFRHTSGDPLVVEDDEEKTGRTGGSTRATSMESEIGTLHLKSPDPREQPKTHGCLSPATTTEPTTEPITEPITSPIDRPISPSVALPQYRGTQADHGGDHGATATVDPLGVAAATPLSHERPQDQGGSALDEEEWEIVRIVGKRRRGKGYEYKVCWKKTWLLERELGNAQELLREFEAKRQAQRGGKRGRPARADKGR